LFFDGALVCIYIVLNSPKSDTTTTAAAAPTTLLVVCFVFRTKHAHTHTLFPASLLAVNLIKISLNKRPRVIAWETGASIFSTRMSFILSYMHTFIHNDGEIRSFLSFEHLNRATRYFLLLMHFYFSKSRDPCCV
jgi:hypothetical protein